MNLEQKLHRARLLVLLLPAISILSALVMACSGPGEASGTGSSASSVVPGDDDGKEIGYGYGYGGHGYGYGGLESRDDE